MNTFVSPFAKKSDLKTEDIIINSLGEVFIAGNEDLSVGSVNISDDPSPQEIAKRFRRQLVDIGLDGEQIALVEKVWKLQEINDGTSRLWLSKGMGRIDTEFSAFKDETGFWNTLEKTAKDIGAEVAELYEGGHVDSYMPNDGKPTKEGDRPNPDRPGWFVGKNHGRIERQVALQATIPHHCLTQETVRAVKKALERGMRHLWAHAGVGVM